MVCILSVVMALTIFGCSQALSAAVSMWKVFKPDHTTSTQSSPLQKEAWQTIFGKHGERGEYMDGYSPQSMMDRCLEDYQWSTTEATTSGAPVQQQRANMMSHLYDHEPLWKHVCMVAFAEHYVLDNNDSIIRQPFDTVQRHKQLHSITNSPIFSGVVCLNWQEDDRGLVTKLTRIKDKGIDYVRIECNLGNTDDGIGGPAQLSKNYLFQRLAEVTKECQKLEMVPLVLLQVPWREPGCSTNYFQQAMRTLAAAFREEGVDANRMLLETRPPIGISLQDELRLGKQARVDLGKETGQVMLEAIDEAFGEIAGFCVAGGSTKGQFPTAMEDDTQNAVRQGVRRCAKERWGYEACFWEMGAKLMLQPKVGQLWGEGKRDAARELFCANAEAMANDILGK